LQAWSDLWCQLGEFIKADDALESLYAALREILREQVHHALATLSEREFQVLEKFSGIVTTV
jgi:DNA-directed RNA polymerase sigma subunit (sigma70/sigma32)